MALTRRFTLRPDQKAAIEEARKAEEAAEKEETVAKVPVEEELAIEVMVPDIKEEEKTEPSKEDPVKEVPNTKEEPEPIPEKVVEEPSEEKAEETVPEKIVDETETIEEKEDRIAAEEAPAEESEELADEPKKAKRTRKTTKKTETEKEESVINVNNNMKKNQELREALAEVIPNYVDTQFAEFKEHMEANLLRTSLKDNTDSGTIRVILSNLGQCYDNVAREYAIVNTNLEHLANKNYGLISRQITMNANGSNEAERKQAGIHAPEIYKAPNGKTMNLYALQAALEAEAIYLQSVIKKLEYKRSLLVSYLTANKIEANMLGD